jgi:hypothetical protein
MEKIRGFDPIIEQDCDTLIFGTVPGKGQTQEPI